MGSEIAVEKARMAAELYATVGYDAAWRAVFEMVSRDDFIPERFFDWDEETGRFRVVSRDVEPESWSRRIYDAEEAIVTQIDEGALNGPQLPSCSSSAPRVMARMLHALGPLDGGRVLEVGTGTGYNAALLSARLGSAHVASVEVDPGVAETARKALARAGYTPQLIVGDGRMGAPDAGPFDAVIVTCAVEAIARSWLEQCPAGRVIAPLARPWFSSACVVLDVRDGIASGRFLDGFSFMRMRGDTRDQSAPDTSGTLSVRGSVSLVRPNRVSSRVDPAAAFAVSLALPDCAYATTFDEDADSYILTAWDRAGSWATVEWTGDPDEYAVRQYGPRDLWDEISAVYRVWAATGQPYPDRYGITVTPHGEHTVWLDHPDQHLNTLIATHLESSRSASGTSGGSSANGTFDATSSQTRSVATRSRPAGDVVS